MYCQPVLCRICECPVADTGVRVDDLDPKKLGNWWVRHERMPKIELDDVAEFLEAQICQFCLWDARTSGEAVMHIVDVERSDWWTGHDTNKFFQKFYYQDQVIQPCSVTMSSSKCSNRPRMPFRLVPLRPQTSKRRIPFVKCTYCCKSFGPGSSIYQKVRRDFKSIKAILCHSCVDQFKEITKNVKGPDTPHEMFHCHMCPKTFPNLLHLLTHSVTVHPNIRLGLNGLSCCSLFFKDAAGLSLHFYDSEKERYCPYCKLFIGDKIEMFKHITKIHTFVAYKCRYDTCNKHFTSKKEMQQHIDLEHELFSPCLYQCPCCPCKYIKSKLRLHLRNVHQLFQCKYPKCDCFFVSEEGLQNHFSVMHPGVKEYVCDYCEKSYFTTSSIMKGHWCVAKPGELISLREVNFSAGHEKELPMELTQKEDHWAESQCSVVENQHASEIPKTYFNFNQKFQCLQCDFTANFQNLIHAHSLAVHGVDSETPKTIEQVKLHTETEKHLNIVSKFQCLKCRFTTDSKSEMQDHIVSVNNSNSNLDEMKTKAESFSNPKIVELPGNSKTCKTHYQPIAPKKFCLPQPPPRTPYSLELPCTYCQETFDLVQDLQAHVENSHRDILIKCTYYKGCPEYFKNEKDLLRHLESYHDMIVHRQR